MKIVLALTLFCLCSFSLSAQTGYSIKGVVADTTAKTKLANTSITVLNSKDSTLAKFGRTAADGSFSLNLTKGSFILLVAYPEYADYVNKFDLDSINKTHDFKQIGLRTKSQLLQEVVVNGVAAITIKGDTTVFSTSKLVIQPNANVEDLLKQLPGIQVDQNGKITAMGQTVQKVLVDGEEFFGDDPTLVTRNIRGDMVKAFELYDQKSDQAKFTGIDDGVKTKTINVQLKDGSKNGYFGKLDGGETPDTYYQGQAMFNKFKEKRKMAAYGTIGNTGKTGLGFEDANKYGASSLIVSDGGAGLPAPVILQNSNDLDNFSGRYDGHGIPLVRSGGAHFDGKWNKDKESFNTNYKIGSLSVDGSQNTATQNNIPGNNSFNSNLAQNYNNSMFRQKLDATYEVKLNATSALKFGIDGTQKNTETNNINNGFSKRSDSTFLNKNTRNVSNDVDQKIFNVSGLWTKRFKKAGRTFSLNVSESLNSNDSKGFLKSTTEVYNTGNVLTGTQIIDQYKTGRSTSSVLGSNMTWSEPFSKTFSLVLNYGLIARDETAQRNSFNKSGTGKYDQLDTQFSNNFDLNQLTNQAGAVFNYTKKKVVFNFGTRISAVNFNQKDLDNDIQYKRNYLNWSPQARYTYRFSQQKSLGFSYNGNTTQPTLEQLQPIRANDDPLNISIGNPDLKPSFRNNLTASYSSFKVLTGRSVYLSASYGLTSNAVGTMRTVDSAGISTFKSFNITGKTPQNFGLSANYGQKIKGTILNFNFYAFTSIFNSYNYINSELNEARSFNYNAGFGLYGNKLKKYSFRVSFDPRLNNSKASLQPQYDDNTWSISSNANFTLYLPGKFEISMDSRFNYTHSSQDFAQTYNPFIWNSGFGKKFFKKENLKLSVSANDLFNQNQGIVRTAYNQNTYTTIQRYFMGSLTWDFTKMATQAKK